MKNYSKCLLPSYIKVIKKPYLVYVLEFKIIYKVDY